MIVRLVIACSLAFVVAVATAGIWTTSPAAVDPVRPPVAQVPDEEVADFMKIKLAAINAAMEAAANGDFEGVDRAGFELSQLSKAAAWKRQADATYQQDTADFVAAAEFLQRMARDEDEEGVTAAYAAVATSCLVCHRHARRPAVASLSKPATAPITVAVLGSL